MVPSLPCTSMARSRAPKTLQVQSLEAEQLHAILFTMHRREIWDSGRAVENQGPAIRVMDAQRLPSEMPMKAKALLTAGFCCIDVDLSSSLAVLK